MASLPRPGGTSVPVCGLNTPSVSRCVYRFMLDIPLRRNKRLKVCFLRLPVGPKGLTVCVTRALSQTACRKNPGKTATDSAVASRHRRSTRSTAFEAEGGTRLLCELQGKPSWWAELRQRPKPGKPGPPQTLTVTKGPGAEPVRSSQQTTPSTTPAISRELSAQNQDPSFRQQNWHRWHSEPHRRSIPGTETSGPTRKRSRAAHSTAHPRPRQTHSPRRLKTQTHRRVSDSNTDDKNTMSESMAGPRAPCTMPGVP